MKLLYGVRPVFADLALIAFLVAQVLDGAFTYVGVATYGTSVEGNPVMLWLMSWLGEGPSLAAAKLVAGTFGVALHLVAVHRVVAVLAAFYVGIAVLPWLAILYLA